VDAFPFPKSQPGMTMRCSILHLLAAKWARWQCYPQECHGIAILTFTATPPMLLDKKLLVLTSGVKMILCDV